MTILEQSTPLEPAAPMPLPLADGQDSARSRMNPWQRASPVAPLVIFSVLAMAVAAVGLVGFEQYRRDIRQAVQKDLFSLTDAKVRQFMDWRAERRKDANALVNDHSFRAEFDRWVRNGKASDERERGCRKRLAALRDAYGYTDILLYDSRAELALSANPDALPPNSTGMDQLRQVLRDGTAKYSDIHYLSKDGHEHVRFGILAPILPAGTDSDTPIGVVLLRTDPMQELFPSIKTWPTNTQSGETFLAKREGDTIVYLTELRYLKTPGVVTRLTVTDEKLLAAQTARGREGLIEGVDYRGVEVIGATRMIPGTSWLIVSKIDKEEIYAPIRRTGWFVGAVILLFVAGAGVTTVFWWRNQSNVLLAKVYEARLMHESVKRRLENFSKYANDIVMLTDEHGRIVEANDRAVEAYGYPLAELQGMHVSVLTNQASPDSSAVGTQRWTRESSVYEAVHRHRDSNSFPVEVSTRSVDLDGRCFHQAIIRDISERKQAEAALIESRQQLRNLSVYQEGLLEEERKHIAREVHDELGQLLTALKMDISLLRLRYGRDPGLLEKLEGMRTLVEETIRVVRSVASNLRPAALDLGLVPAIEWLAEDFSRRREVNCKVDLSGDEISLDDPTATAVFRVVQESLTNVARHARASEVIVSLHSTDRLSVLVKDNGRGFDPAAVRKLPGLGLFGMRERILALGGTLKIDSAPGKGTTLAIELPFSPDTRI